MVLSTIQKTLVTRIEQFRAGIFNEGATVMRYLVETLGFGGAESLVAIAKATDRAAEFPYRLTDLRKTSAMKDALADAPDGTLLGLGDAAGSAVTGTTTNGGATAAESETASFIHCLSPDYVDGEAVTVRVRAKVSVARTVAATVDVVAKEIGDGALGADICATAAQNLSTAYANYDFTITPTGLVAGDRLQIDLTLATDDTGGASDGLPTITKVSVLETIAT